MYKGTPAQGRFLLEVGMTFFPIGRLGMLGKYLSSLQQMTGAGKVIARGNQIDDLSRLIATYGGKASDWSKVVSTKIYKGIDGKFSTHWYQKAGKRIEIKTVFNR